MYIFFNYIDSFTHAYIRIHWPLLTPPRIVAVVDNSISCVEANVNKKNIDKMFQRFNKSSLKVLIVFTGGC